MIQRIRRWLGRDSQATPAPPEPDYTAQVEAWANSMRKTHLVAPLNGEKTWFPKATKGSVWSAWRYAQTDPEAFGTRILDGPKTKDSITDNVAHSPDRLPGQVW